MQAVARYGIRAGIIVLGAVFAVGSIHRTKYLKHVSLVERVAASDSAANAKLSSLVAAVTPVRRNGLDAGFEHPRIDYWVSRLSTTMSGGMSVSLGRMPKYADMIRAKLEAKKLPKELIYLAMIESEFNPNAKSPVKAVGMWQFMKGTAKQFGLRVNGGVDDRKNPALATDAAVKYLSNLHDRFGSWYLAAAAYNSGEGTVQRALMRVTGKTTGTDDDFFRILPVLPKETQDYVPKLIAASRIGSAPEQYGITPKIPSATLVAAVAPVSKAKVKFVSVAKTKTKVKAVSKAKAKSTAKSTTKSTTKSPVKTKAAVSRAKKLHATPPSTRTTLAVRRAHTAVK